MFMILKINRLIPSPRKIGCLLMYFCYFERTGQILFIFVDDGLVSSSFPGIFCLHIGDTPSETPVPVELTKITVNPTTSKVLVNGKIVEFEAYNINGYNYFKLRDLAQAVNNTEKNLSYLGCGKQCNQPNLKQTLHSIRRRAGQGDGKAKVAIPTTSKIYKDGREIFLTAYNITATTISS